MTLGITRQRPGNNAIQAFRSIRTQERERWNLQVENGVHDRAHVFAAK